MYAQETPFTLSVKEKTIKDVFRLIEQESPYRFLYNDDFNDLNRTVTLDIKENRIESVLDKVLNKSEITYKILENNLIVITPVEMPRQRLLITGKVTNSHGDPLPGVSVIVEGTTTGTTTSVNGDYRITIPGANAVLNILYIGYDTQTIPVDNQSVINVTLIESAVAIDEIEVIGIGYGEIRRRDVTGALDIADIKAIQKTTVGSALDALSGRISGVQIISADGTPGQGSSVVIRGSNSITGNNNPLYVVDGFPMEDDYDLGLLDPSEIESMVVLKDASSTAIYGSRGANGVIMVTTKRGVASKKPVISYRGIYGMENVSNRMDVMTPYEFAAMEMERTGTNTYGGLPLEAFRDIAGIDWQGLLFRRGWTQTHTLSVRGGTEDTKYNFTAGYRNQDGVIITSNYKRYNLKMDLDQQVTKWLKGGLTLSYTHDVYTGAQPSESNNVVGADNMHFSTMYSCWGYRPVLVSDGEMLAEDELLDPEGLSELRVNPIEGLRNTHLKRYRNSLYTNAYLTFKLTGNLSFKTIGRVSKSFNSSERFNNSRTQSGYQSSTRRVNGSVSNSQGSGWVNENILTWEKRVRGSYKITATGAATFEKSGSDSYGYASDHIPNEQVGMAGISDGITYSTSSSIAPGTSRMSFLGRVIFDYRSKYLATISTRADASSRFAKGHRWGYFPSASLAWNFTQEDFLKGSQILSNGKLRVSYGWTGNDRIQEGDRYQQMVVSYDYSYPVGYEWRPSSFISYPGNRKLKWEGTEQTNIGIDLGFFKNRMALKVDVYRKNTHDLLLSQALPLATGYTSLRRNIGQVRNQGLEITINSVNIKSPSFEWRTDFNIAANENKIVALADGQPSMRTTVRGIDSEFNSQTPYIARVGKPVGAFYGYIWDGVYPLDDFIYSNTGIPMAKPNVPVYVTNQQPGDIKYRDVNGDGVIDDFDRQIIGNSQPLFFGGMNNTFSYKAFDLNIFFRWSYGNYALNANRLGMENGARRSTNQFKSFANRWSLENQDTDMHRVGSNGTYYYSSRIIEDASFLRLQSVSLGYSIPKAWLSKVSISALRLSMAVNNIFVWTNYSGFDPEVSSRHSALTPAFDFSSYPRARTLALTLNVTF